MSPRVFAIVVCLFASGRWPRLRHVAIALACEALASLIDERTAEQWPTLARVAWCAPSSVLIATGTNYGARWQRSAAATLLVLVCIVGLSSAAHESTISITCGASALAALLLARRTVPRDVERSALLVALVGTVATSALALLVGTHDAYAHDVVLTSNQITHLAIAALVLWAMRR